MIILLAVWLLSLTILTYAFGGVLLNTYFNINILPVVTNLLDIYFKKNLIIVGNPFHVQLIGQTKAIAEDKLNELVTRMINFINDTNFNYDTQMFDSHVFAELVRGRAVIVCDSLVSDAYQRHFQKWSQNYIALEDKYLPDYANLLVHKVNPYSEFVRFL